jgi:hypothetical protein
MSMGSVRLSGGRMRLCLVVLAFCATAVAPVARAARVTDSPRLPGQSSATSSNWAGYAATGSSYQSVAASWTEPAVSCAPGETAYSSFWVGLDGYASRTVEQIGTDADCINGQPTYYAWYELYPKMPVRLQLPVGAGSAINASVQAGSAGSFTLTLTAAGTALTVTGNSYHAALSSAEVIAEAPSSNHGPFGALGLADFGTVTFTNATVNGSPLAASNPDEITMAQGSTMKAQPSSLNADTFSVTWAHS